jgi:hypothetical protein
LIQKIRFLHIPKTAGTTFDECLFRQYLGPYLLRRQFVFSGNIAADQRRLARMSEAALERIAICTGHAPLVTGCAQIDALPTVTLLREPVERVKSLCRHISEGKSPQIYCREKHGVFDLDALLGSGRIQLNNFQSRIVLGEGGYKLPAASESALADRAMALLASRFVCFGLTGELDRSLLLFQRVLGWQKWPLYRSRNTSNPEVPLQFEARHIARIEELNRLDIALYERARETFFRRWQEHGAELEAALPRFRSALAKPQPHFAVIDLARQVGKWRRLVSPGP